MIPVFLLVAAGLLFIASVVMMAYARYCFVTYSRKLSDCLDGMIAGRKDIEFEEEEDSLTTNMQRLVLHYILFESLKREIYQKDVEKEFQIRRSTATGTLQILEKNGFITRKPVEKDARLKKLVITDKGEAICQTVYHNICEMEELLVRGMTAKEVDTMLTLLDKVKKNLL